MKSSVRFGSLLVAAVGALALPAGAWAQLDPAGEAARGTLQAVEQSVPPVEAPAPDVFAPSKPSAPDPVQSPAAGNRAPAAAPSAPGADTASRRPGQAVSTERNARRTRSSRRSHARRSGAGKAHAASSAGADRALAPVRNHATARTVRASSFTAGAEPDTGGIEDSRLPFTGGYTLPFLALGAGALLAGFALRTSPRLRPARSRGD